MAFALLLGGCSMVEFGYRQLDWIMLQRIEEFVDLDGQQRRRLEQDIDALLDWHCRTQLPAYAALLDDIRQDFQRGAVTPKVVSAYSERIEGLWYAILDHGTEGAGRLLASLSDRQISELDAALAERNAEIADEVRDLSPEAASEDYAESAEDHWERWLGDLNPRQVERIADWSHAFRPLGSIGVAYRDLMRRRLKGLAYRHRDDPAGMQAGLADFLAELRNAPPPDYAKLTAANEAISIDMVMAVAAAAEPEQLGHLAKVARGWRRDIAAIGCR